MEGFIGFSAIFFMPIYALIFIVTLISSLKRIRKNEELTGIEYVCGIAFALLCKARITPPNRLEGVVLSKFIRYSKPLF
ncbi:hypothetical protein [Paenibacillus spongiae]|uniref:Uncharacterized protein n=1 Tax=Paenibacillus spongiae TaxID=2909671 RepID=A0ABY5SA67_9BACL|nr:hypothetical protein [Paenibacillus spongiae]UVI29680.1 hypothetical protein L1F29_30430 [Paenibacillus spongiae]